MTYEVAANYKVLLENYNECYHCGPVHPELCRLVPSFAGGGAAWTGTTGIPHREGAWTFTMTGTTTRAPLPGLTRGGAHPAQGRPGLPEPAALGVGRPRRRVRAAAAGGRPHRRGVLAALRRRRGRPLTASTRATPPSCGTWSTGRTGRCASRCSAACRRAATGTAGSRRWRTTASTSAAGCCRCSRDAMTSTDDEHVDYVVDRARRPRQRHRHGARAQRARGRRARAVRARPLVGRQPRHQPDPAAQLPHARRTSG